MKYLPLTFHCRLTARAAFSRYKGSMLRGTLGTFLKKTCCTVRETDCRQCMLGNVCAYPDLFLGKTVRGAGRYDSLTLPFVLVPGDTGRTDYEAGETFTFGLHLLSYAISFLPYFVHAFALAGRHGMGQRTDSARGTFELTDITWQGTSVYDAATQKVHTPEGEELQLPQWDSGKETGTQRLVVTLTTPCRFKEGNRFATDLPFRQLLLLVVRRLRALWALDGMDVRYEDFHGMMTQADTIRTVTSTLFWADWTRYSSRQKTYMQLGGLQGQICYEGALVPFLPFLAMAGKLHLGKQTSFGLGEVHFDCTQLSSGN